MILKSQHSYRRAPFGRSIPGGCAMTDIERSTADHYTQRNLYDSIIAALKRMGKTPDALTADDLAPVDSFHVRGRAATLELGQLADLSSEDSVLDVGCGLGGSARHLAAEFGCRVTGLDLTPEYVSTATRLTAHLKLDDRVDFRLGNALELPFDDGTFDAVWSEHAQMNIPDKPRMYGEILRVLKSGGRFLFHDILQGPEGEPIFPAPWAGESSHSALIAPAEFRKLLQSLGFDIIHWEDKTAVGRQWFAQRLADLREKGPPPLGFHLLLGALAMEAQENNLRNLKENRIALFQGVVRKVR